MKKISVFLVCLMLVSSFSYAVPSKVNENAMIHSGVKMFAIRDLADEMNLNLKWDNHKKTLSIIYEDKNLEIRPGQTIAMLSGKKINLDHPVVSKNGRIYVSEMVLKDVLGLTINYDEGKANVKLESKKDIIDTALASGEFTTLAAALQSAGLIDTLKGTGPFTVFAPTDAAFNKLPSGTVEELLKPENKDLLTNILKYHVSDKKMMAKDITSMTSITMLNGETANIEVKGNKVSIDGADIIITDIETSNGIIHVIDTIMVPGVDIKPPALMDKKEISTADKDIIDTAIADGNFKTFITAVEAAGLKDTLKAAGPFTVFVPSDKAFAKLPKGTLEDLLKPENKDKLIDILKYHVADKKLMATDVSSMSSLQMLNGKTAEISIKNKKIDIDGANISSTDIMASNGVIHVIDDLMMP